MRPAVNHAPSPMSAPRTAATKTGQKDSEPAAIAEPANSSIGTAGIGTPRRVNRTFRNTAAAPQVETAEDGNSTNWDAPAGWGLGAPCCVWFPQGALLMRILEGKGG